MERNKFLEQEHYRSKLKIKKKRLVQGASNLEGDLETSKSLQNFSKYKYYLS